MEKLYEGFQPGELEYIQHKKNQNVITRIASRTESIVRQAIDWTAIYTPFLQSINKKLIINSDYVYFSSAHLENHYPVKHDQGRAYPFDATAEPDEFKIRIIGTTTGVKVYEYAELLTAPAIPEELRWTHLTNIDVLLVQNQTHKVKVYKNSNTIIVLTSQINNRFVKEVLATFPSLFSIIELQTNQNVTNCLRAVINNTSIRPYFDEMFNAIADEKTEKINKILKDSLTIGIRKRDDDLRHRIDQTKHTIQSYENDLERNYELLQQLYNEKLGIEEKLIENPESFKELKTFLKNYKFIKELHLKEFSLNWNTSEKLIIELEAPITLFEPEPLQRQIVNLSNRYNNTGKDCLDVLAEIFLKDEYTLYCTTFVGLDLADNSFSASSGSLRLNNANYHRMEQPHLAEYNCWGDQKTNIKRALMDNNLIDAIQLMGISIQNINFTDTAVLTRWIEHISNSNYFLKDCKCIKDKQNNWYTFMDIIKILEARRCVPAPTGEVGQPELIDELEGEE